LKGTQCPFFSVHKAANYEGNQSAVIYENEILLGFQMYNSITS